MQEQELISSLKQSSNVAIKELVDLLKNSVQRLNPYAQRFHIERLRPLLTSNKDEIYSMARKSYFANGETRYYKSSNEFLHTENYTLIDKQGRCGGAYDATLKLEMNKLVEHIKILQQQ